MCPYFGRLISILYYTYDNDDDDDEIQALANTFKRFGEFKSMSNYVCVCTSVLYIYIYNVRPYVVFF